MPGYWLSHPLLDKVRQIVAQSHSKTKEVASVQVETHLRSSKVQPLKHFQRHMRTHRPKIYKDLILHFRNFLAVDQCYW